MGALFAAKEPRYLLNRRLGKSQNWFGRSGEEENPLPLPGIDSRIVQSVA
jgi:hypothetical protein